MLLWCKERAPAYCVTQIRYLTLKNIYDIYVVCFIETIMKTCVAISQIQLIGKSIRIIRLFLTDV